MKNLRTIVVTRREAGETLAAVLHKQLALSWSAAKKLIAAERVRIGTTLCTDPAHRVKAGHRLNIVLDTGGKSSREEGQGFVVRHDDADVVVVDKPAGVTTMRHASEAAEFGARAQRYLPATLADLLSRQLAEGRRRVELRAVHRLDRDTSGLVVFARTPEAERRLGMQFRAHTVGRRYLAVVRGQAQPGRIESHLIRDRGDGRRGSSADPAAGKPAVTHVRVLEDLGDFTLVECRLETGRTHQVRIHLGEQGTPICGETVYDRPLHGAPLPDQSGAPRLALHATHLAFDHPATGTRMSWTSPLPDDLADLVQRLRERMRKPGAAKPRPRDTQRKNHENTR